MKPAINHKDFLCDNLFIYWRIHPTKELDSFWMDFLKDNEGLQTPFNKAIEEFELIRDKQDSFRVSETSKLRELDGITGKGKARKLRKMFASSAAAILLILLVSTLFFLREKSGNEDTAITTIGEVMGSGNIQLFTGNNVLEIDNHSTLDLSGKKQGAVIQNPLARKEIELNDNRANKLVVPYGKRTTLILADGSKVYLNSGTKIGFPSVFDGKKREIDVEGEIFIEVVKQGNIPFVIHTPHSRITVRGTSFNVSSYPEDAKESVVLVNGSVEVKSENSAMLLQPNEMAEVENGMILRKEVDVTDYTGWTNGYLQLNKSPLNEVLKKIGRYYNIKFQYDAGVPLHNQTCSGKLFLSDNLDDVLEAFSKMTYLQYDKQGDETIFIRQ